MERINDLVATVGRARCFPVQVYTPIFGKGIVQEVTREKIVVLSEDSHVVYEFNRDGSLEIGGECLLFPSYENRDWSKLIPSVTVVEKEPKQVYWFEVTENKTWNEILYNRLKTLSGGLKNCAHPIPKKGDIWFNEHDGLTCCQRENKIARMVMMVGKEIALETVND